MSSPPRKPKKVFHIKKSNRNGIESCPASENVKTKSKHKTKESLFTKMKKILSLEAGIDTLFHNNSRVSVNSETTIDVGEENAENKVDHKKTKYRRSSYSGLEVPARQSSFIVDTFLTEEGTSTCSNETSAERCMKIKELERVLHDALKKLIQVKLEDKCEKKEDESQRKDISYLAREIAEANEKQIILEMALYEALHKANELESEKNGEINCLEQRLKEKSENSCSIEERRKIASEKQIKLERVLLDALNSLQEVKQRNLELETELEQKSESTLKEDYEEVIQKLQISEKEFLDVSEKYNSFKIKKENEIQDLQEKLMQTSDANEESVTNTLKFKELEKEHCRKTKRMENQIFDLQDKLRVGRKCTKCFIDNQKGKLLYQRKIFDEMYGKISRENECIKKIQNRLKNEKSSNSKCIQEISERQMDVHDAIRNVFRQINQMCNDFENAFDKHTKMVSQRATLNQLSIETLQQKKGCLLTKRRESIDKDLKEENEDIGYLDTGIGEKVSEYETVSEFNNKTANSHVFGPENKSIDDSNRTGESGDESTALDSMTLNSCKNSEISKASCECEANAVGKLRKLWQDFSDSSPSAWYFMNGSK